MGEGFGGEVQNKFKTLNFIKNLALARPGVDVMIIIFCNF
jgi:hypothetical protein